MPLLMLGGRRYEVDERGFLRDPKMWSEEFAEEYAKREGIKLTEEHWKVINYLREYFMKNSICPPVKRLTKEVGLSLKRIYELFPEGPANQACKWAGIPKPTGCV